MPYSIQTKDGIKINNIPDDIAPDSDVIKQRVASIRASKAPSSPVDEMSAMERGLAGAGKAIVDTGRGLEQVAAQGAGALKQISDASGGLINRLPFINDVNRLANYTGINTPEYAQQVQTEIDEAKRLDAPLMNTTAGKVGNAVGTAAATLPTAFIPGVNTYKGAAAVGGLMGALAPVESGADRLTNTASGAAFGVAGQGAGKAIGAAGNKLFQAMGVIRNSADDVARVGAQSGNALPEPSNQGSWLFKFETPTKAKVRELLEAGELDRSTAGYMLNGAGRVVKDPVARKAIKSGIDDGVVVTAKAASAKDKQVMNEMLNILEAGRKNPLFAQKIRPSDPIGKGLLGRFQAVKSANAQAASQLDDIAKSLQGKPFDGQPIGDKFIADLDSMLGVKVKPNGALDYSESSIDGLEKAQAIINKLYLKMRSYKQLDGYKAHQLKKFIDENVDWGKQGEGLTGKTEGFVKGIRRSIDQALDGSFPEYNAVNTQYSDTIQALKDFQKVAGKSFNYKSDNADKMLGTLSRRLLSNAQSRVPLMDSIASLESTAAKYGTKFDDDIFAQALFVDEIERLFPATARTSLQGDMEKAAGKAFDLATGQQTARGAAVEAIKAGANKVFGKGDDEAIKVLRELINSR